MNGRETGNRVTLMVFDSSFDVILTQVTCNFKVFFGLLIVEILKHCLYNTSSRESNLFLKFLLDIITTLTLDLSNESLSKLCQQFPDEMDFFFTILRQRIS